MASWSPRLLATSSSRNCRRPLLAKPHPLQKSARSSRTTCLSRQFRQLVRSTPGRGSAHVRALTLGADSLPGVYGHYQRCYKLARNCQDRQSWLLRSHPRMSFQITFACVNNLNQLSYCVQITWVVSPVSLTVAQNFLPVEVRRLPFCPLRIDLNSTSSGFRSSTQFSLCSVYVVSTFGP